MNDKIIAQCQHYLAGGKTKEAIQLLLAHEIGDKNELVGALGRLNDLGKKTRIGTATEPFISQEENSIRHAVLMHLDAVAFFEKPSKSTVLPISVQRPNTWIWAVGIVALLAAAIFGGYQWGNFACLQSNSTNSAIERTTKATVPTTPVTDSTKTLPETKETPKQQPTKPAETKPDVRTAKQGTATQKAETPSNPTAKKASYHDMLASAETACKSGIKDFTDRDASKIRQLGECLFVKNYKKEGIAKMSEVIKEWPKYDKGYYILDKYLRLSRNKELAIEYLPVITKGLEEMKKDVNFKSVYEEDYKKLQKMKNELIQDFGI